jgi:RNA polymerase sigma factor (sigma-70 family)
MFENLKKTSNVRSNHERSSEDNFWLEFYPGLQQYCRFLSQNKWDGDDIAQEAILKAMKYYKHKPDICSALLNKIAYNHWIDTIRKKKKENIETDLESLKNEQTNQSFNLHETVEYLMSQFTPKQAVILTLKEAFLYRTREIADILQTTEMAVKSVLHRAKKRCGKDKEQERDHDTDAFSAEEEKELLGNLLYTSLESQDPTILIETIPSLDCLSGNVNSPVSCKKPILFIPKSSPSGPLCMAA